MPSRSIAVRAAAAAPLLLLALTACGGGAVQGTVASPTSSSAAPSSAAPSSSAPEPASSSATAQETATPEGTAAPVTLPALPGYDYADAPNGFESMATTLKDTGMISGVKVAGVQKGGEMAAVVIAAQYNDGLVDAIGAMPARSLLESVAAGAKPSLTGKVTQKFTKVGGTDVLLLTSPSVSVAIAYFDDGLLVQLYGPDQAEVLKVATALVKARNAQ